MWCHFLSGKLTSKFVVNFLCAYSTQKQFKKEQITEIKVKKRSK